uniref:Uncharacterized protein n=1 Tax=Arundo donax TaxID=35708 RepID=A0A0A9BAW0_ARUDO
MSQLRKLNIQFRLLLCAHHSFRM